MAEYSKAGATVRIVSLLMIIVLLIFGVAPLLLQLLGIPLMENPIFTWATRPFGITASAPSQSNNSNSLIEQERLVQLQMSIEEREQAVRQREEQMNGLVEELKAREEILIAQEADLQERIAILEIRMLSVGNLDRNLLANAEYLNNMPPAQAVAILEQIEDDQVLIDHLRASDRYAQSQGRVSLTSVWISMMNAERAGRVMAKMVTP